MGAKELWAQTKEPVDESKLDRIVLVSALDLEQQGFHANMDDLRPIKSRMIKDFTFYEGLWNGLKVNTLTTNMGETNAVLRFQDVLNYVRKEQGNLDRTAAIFYGVGGGLVQPCSGLIPSKVKGSGLLPKEEDRAWEQFNLAADNLSQNKYFVKQGDIVVIQYAIDGDESVSSITGMNHLDTGEMPIGVDINDTQRIWVPDAYLVDNIVKSAKDAGLAKKMVTDGYSQQSKKFINLGYVQVDVEPNWLYQNRVDSIDDPQKEKHLAEAKHFFAKTRQDCQAQIDGNNRLPNVLDMETASIFKTAYHSGLPVAAVRVISDYYGSHPDDFMAFIEQKSGDGSKHLTELFNRIGEKR